MLDGWIENVADCSSNDFGRPTWLKVFIRLFLLYLVLAAMCYTESRFRKHAIELVARTEVIGAGPKCSQLIRYHFHDPVTGAARMNTVTIPRNQKPPSATALIEYIPGEYPTSRLKEQARPGSITIFYWMNLVYCACAAGFIGYLAWEANRPICRTSRATSNNSKTFCAHQTE